MSLLLLLLPSGAPGTTGYAYATSGDGQTLLDHGSAPAPLLPPAGRGVEVVAVVPAARLSWHRVRLPQGVRRGSPRLRAVLAGLLEDQLLDEADELHLALQPGAARNDVWVAACRHDWLAAHLQVLDAAQRPVSRIVPEQAPREGALTLTVIGEPERAQLLIEGGDAPGRAQALPFSAATLALLPTQALHADPQDEGPAPLLRAEPAVAEWAEQVLQRPVALVPAAERLLQASRGDWDLAQFDLARSGRARAAKRAGAFWRDFLHSPLWRPARWGVLVLLLAHVVGLNVWAWRTQGELAARRADIQRALTDTFPQVKVVVDAPTQMAREVALLRQSTGAATARDLEPMLSAFGQFGQAQQAPTAIEYGANELRLKGVAMAAAALEAANQRLQPLAYRLQAEGDTLVLRLEGAP